MEAESDFQTSGHRGRLLTESLTQTLKIQIFPSLLKVLEHPFIHGYCLA